MKRLLFMVLALVLIMGMAIPVAAATEDDPFHTDLFAGQHIDVGDVLVWDDGNTLYVEYVINSPWVMTQSHLHIATSLVGIPQTKKGNPIPGQFEWGEYYAPPVDADTFNFDLSQEGWYGAELHIAAHAVVIDTSTCPYETETAWADGTDFPGKNWATYFTYNTPCAEPSGSLYVTGTGWKSDSAWCPCNYTYDLTTTGDPVALQGFVDTSAAALANTGDWSKYYAKFSLWDSGGNVVEIVFNNDWLGPWYEMDAQQWDRIRMENNMGFPQPEQWYATVGGVLGYDTSGAWVGPGNGATVYPSDRNYFFQLIADPDANTFTLQVYGMGSGEPDNPPADWPKQNMFDEAKWLEIGIIDVGEAFDFEEVNLCAILWASTQAGAEDESTIYWDGMSFGVPLTFGETP